MRIVPLSATRNVAPVEAVDNEAAVRTRTAFPIHPLRGRNARPSFFFAALKPSGNSPPPRGDTMAETSVVSIMMQKAGSRTAGIIELINDLFIMLLFSQMG
jgi:hypothetical protein